MRSDCIASVFEEVAAFLRLKAVECLADELPEALAGPLGGFASAKACSLDIGPKTLAVNSTIEDAGHSDPAGLQAGHQGGHVPMPVRHWGQ